MFCFIYKWMISRNLDTGKELPALINRHIRRCGTCREFARASESLNAGLVRDAPGILRGNHEALNEKIISALEMNPESRLTPRRKFNFMPIPALATALGVVVLVTGIILNINSVPSPGDKNPLEELSGTILAGNPFQAMEPVETPMEKEMHHLGQSIHSAAEFLVSCLDIKIGQGGGDTL